MWKAFISSWKNIFNYTGRSGRKEFWISCVMNVISMYAGLIPIAIIINIFKMLGLLHLMPSTAFSVIYVIVFFVPMVSLYVRRANDLGLCKFDTALIGIATPAVGAIVIGLFPSFPDLSNEKLPWFVRTLIIGFGLFIYGAFFGTLVLGSLDAIFPVVVAGLLLSTFSMIYGAIKNSKQ